MTSTTMILIRHGDTGDDSRLRGWYDPPLSERGRRQAEQLTRRLGAGLAPAAVYTSPLRRALETVAPLAEFFQLPLRPVEGLREIDCGEFDGRRVTEIQQQFPEIWARNAAQDDDDFRWPGGESYAEFRRRVWATLNDLAAAHQGERIFAGVHTGVITQALGTLDSVRPARWSVYLADKASITELRWENGTPTVVAFNDQSHLSSAELSSMRPRAG